MSTVSGSVETTPLAPLNNQKLVDEDNHKALIVEYTHDDEDSC